MTHDFSPRYRKPRRRMNRASRSRYPVAEQFPTAAERERQKALERTESLLREAALAELHGLQVKLNDRRAPLEDILRLIAARMAGVIEEMQQPTSSLRLKGLQTEMKALRTITKVLIDADRVQPQEQELHFEAPKFQTALMFLCSLFSRTLREAGFDDEMVNSFFLQLRDRLDAEEANLRRAVAEA